MNWVKGLAGLWFTVWLGSMAQDYVPTSFWFEPGDIMIEDTRQGVCPTMHYTRIIHRPFHAEWIVTLWKQGPTGDFFFYKTYPLNPPGMSNYREDSVLPDPMTFDWWAWIEKEDCDWEPGVYQVVTQWKMDVGHTARLIRVTSNSFYVSPY